MFLDSSIYLAKHMLAICELKPSTPTHETRDTHPDLRKILSINEDIQQIDTHVYDVRDMGTSASG